MHFAGVVEVDPEVLVVENGLDAVVGGVVAGVLTASGGLDKEILLNFSRASADEDPSVKALAGVFIIRLVVGLVIVDGDGFSLFLKLGVDAGLLGLLVKFRFADGFLNNLEGLVFLLDFLSLGSLVLILVNLGVFVAHGVIVAKVEGADHETLVLGGDFLRCSAVADIGVVPSSNQDGAQGNGEIKGVTILPGEHIGDGRNVQRKLVRLSQLFVIQVAGDELGGAFVVV